MPDAGHLRCVTLNVLGAANPDWDRRRVVIRDALQRLRPDVVALQEVRSVDVEQLLGPDYVVTPFSATSEDGTGGALATRAPHRVLEEIDQRSVEHGQHLPWCATLIVECATRGSAGLSEDLTLLLQERGFVEEAQAVRAHTRSNALDGLEWWRNYDHDANRRVLAVLADRPAEELNYQERTRLDELADLLETLDLNDISSQHMLKQVDVLPSVVELVATLHGFNLALLAAQATLTLERMDAVEGSEPYYVLFAWAQERTTADWATVSGVEQAVRLLVPILTWGMASAEVAARALWAAPPPVRDIAAPLLRELLPRLTSSPRHERLAAYTLCSLEVDGPEPAVWLDSDDPVLRAVLARTCPSADDNYLSPELVRLLDDPDGHVRKAAIKRVHELGPPDLDQVLAAQAAAPKPGWMCLYCRTPNPPGASGCTKDRCFGSGPDPSALATQLRTDPGDQCED